MGRKSAGVCNAEIYRAIRIDVNAKAVHTRSDPIDNVMVF